MDLKAFYFAQPLWLVGLAVIPVLWTVFFLFFRPRPSSLHHLKSMIDPHLLPFLLISDKTSKTLSWKMRLLCFSVLWGCLLLALAGPRWSFRDIDMLSKDQSLVILLDLSESMDAAD